LSVAPAAREGLVARVISTGVQLTRNDRRANEVELPHSSEMDLASVAGAAANAVDEAGLRTLTTVKTEHGTAHYPVLPVARAHQMIRNRSVR